MIRIVFVIIVGFVCSFAVAQNKSGQEFFSNLSEQKEGEGFLSISQPEDIQDLVGIHLDCNKRAGGVDGFRIQLFLGSGKDAKKQAGEVKAKVLELFPEEKIYLMYEAPFWRIQVGDFRSKSESLQLYRELKKEFPSCYPVPVDNIQMSNLK
ncbi:SPOR domain-containing protein [Plebeiibacterium marinum]|uniref:SPOR domain-containing protein n=1 Tax=Plebeiibacterium marinum TaxID=2992111 RepID=A0AAE3MAG1_9BACT|nr:SPOR domain-containing protein [Plebeiobacterium marinum]MCW3804261.1 SPOR domain-containing protein [Plebeiobacterium marinum]